MESMSEPIPPDHDDAGPERDPLGGGAVAETWRRFQDEERERRALWSGGGSSLAGMRTAAAEADRVRAEQRRIVDSHLGAMGVAAAADRLHTQQKGLIEAPNIGASLVGMAGVQDSIRRMTEGLFDSRKLMAGSGLGITAASIGKAFEGSVFGAESAVSKAFDQVGVGALRGFEVPTWKFPTVTAADVADVLPAKARIVTTDIEPVRRIVDMYPRANPAEEQIAAYSRDTAALLGKLLVTLEATSDLLVQVVEAERELVAAQAAESEAAKERGRVAGERARVQLRHTRVALAVGVVGAVAAVASLMRPSGDAAPQPRAPVFTAPRVTTPGTVPSTSVGTTTPSGPAAPTLPQ